MEDSNRSDHEKGDCAELLTKTELRYCTQILPSIYKTSTIGERSRRLPVIISLPQLQQMRRSSTV